MAVSTRVQPIDRDLILHLNAEASPAERSRQFAEFAREAIREAEEANRRTLGAVPRKRTFVDGRENAPLSSVRPNGVIVADFELIGDVIGYISEQLWRHSPRKSGRFQQSHRIYGDGILVGTVSDNSRAVATMVNQAPFDLASVDEWVFVSLVPYARKIERGISPQAPSGVYQAVAFMARRRFGNIARIDFSFRTAIGGEIIGGRAGDRAQERNPAVVVRVRK